jgi:hypothetical protein
MENLKYYAELNEENIVVNTTTWQQNAGNVGISTEVTDLVIEYFTEYGKFIGSTEEEIQQKIEDYFNETSEIPEYIPTQDVELFEYSLDNSITNNKAEIGYTYNKELNAFIPPKPDETYILNYETFIWEPDLEVSYDLHGDGLLYKYNKELNGWTPLET